MYTHLGMNSAKLGRSSDALEFLQKGNAFYEAASIADPASAKSQRGKTEVREQLASEITYPTSCCCCGARTRACLIETRLDTCSVSREVHREETRRRTHECVRHNG